MTPGSKPFTVVSSPFFTKIWSYRAEIEIFLNKYQIFFKGFDENSRKLDMNITYTFTCGNFDLFYIKFSWIFLEFRNWYAPKNSKRASRTNCKLQCVFIQCSCDLSPKWRVSVGVTFLSRHKSCRRLSPSQPLLGSSRNAPPAVFGRSVAWRDKIRCKGD